VGLRNREEKRTGKDGKKKSVRRGLLGKIKGEEKWIK
jgi:hypothetical protein